MTTISELNEQIAKCNPYTDKEFRRYLVGQRRKLEKQISNSVKDVISGNVPDMWKPQA